MSNFEKMRAIIGDGATKKLVDGLQGKTVRIRKKMRFSVREYKKNKEVLDSFSNSTAARYLKCSPRYLKKLKATTGK